MAERLIERRQRESMLAREGGEIVVGPMVHLRGVLEKLTFPEDVIVTVDVDAYQLL